MPKDKVPEIKDVDDDIDCEEYREEVKIVDANGVEITPYSLVEDAWYISQLR